MLQRDNCPLCNSKSRPKHECYGNLDPDKLYTLNECVNCGYIFVQNPRTDYENLYDDNYYAGKGADPVVNYSWESIHPEKTIRGYEWQAIIKIFKILGVDIEKSQCLDYGCGTGGFVLYGNKLSGEGGGRFYGYDASSRYICDDIDRKCLLSDVDLPSYENFFDAACMIEVLEHLEDPVAELKKVRKLMKKGGILFLTTGNADPWRKRLGKWHYIIPEIHLGYFAPKTWKSYMKKLVLSPCIYRLPP